NDVNVAVKADQGDAGRVPACSVRSDDVLNFCALYEKGPVVLALFAPRSQECTEQLDQLDDAARRHPEVAFAAVSIRGKLDDVRDLVRDRRWSFPVGYDDDGVLANAYGVVVCPQLNFVRQGGSVQDTALGAIAPRALEAKIDALAAAGPTGATGTTGG
ncbi:MAG: redoxin domain-containing protein, partial [Solirubrobacterales bacterium]|nr:redoxin domain-containing protein [Solirubrobacterales bacterium]